MFKKKLKKKKQKQKQKNKQKKSKIEDRAWMRLKNNKKIQKV